MDTLLGILGPIFWGLLLLSVLVFVHEGGHFLAARACGVRVTEFFLGLPCRFNVHHVSRRIGTKFGVTPLLLGGYAEICGMDPTQVDCAPQVLAYVHEHGRANVERMAEDLGLDAQDAMDACALLAGWGSVAPAYDMEHGERPNSREWPGAFASMPRDAAGNTIYDGRAFDRTHATAKGDPWVAPAGAQAFYEAERSRTYIGQGFWKRAFMLVAGIAVNILTGFLLMVGVYSGIGVETYVDVNAIGSVAEGSPAEAAGLQAGDRILTIDGVDTEGTWMGILSALDGAETGETVRLSVWRPNTSVDAQEADEGSNLRDADWRAAHGSAWDTDVTLSEDGTLGIQVSTEVVHLNPLDSCRIAVSAIVQTAQSVASLLNPQHTMEVLDNSTSIVGISVMSSQAAAAGAASFLGFAALISFSLGFMNLLPIPPLDGGKLLIEAVQAITRRELSVRVQSAISLVGVGLFLLLFLYMLRADFLRFF